MACRVSDSYVVPVRFEENKVSNLSCSCLILRRTLLGGGYGFLRDLLANCSLLSSQDLLASKKYLSTCIYYGFNQCFVLYFVCNYSLYSWSVINNCNYDDPLIRKMNVKKPGINNIRGNSLFQCWIRISAWAYLKGISSLSSLHYLCNCSAHLDYHVHKNGGKTSITIITTITRHLIKSSITIIIYIISSDSLDIWAFNIYI